MESHTRGIEAGRSVLRQTALDADPPHTYASAACGIVVDRRTDVQVGDSIG